MIDSSQLDPGLYSFNAADAAGVPQLDDTFISYIQDVLWKQGIDVSSMDPNQLTQLYMNLWNDTFVQDIYNENAGAGQPTPTGTTIKHDAEALASLTDSNIETAIRNELFDPTKTHNQYLVSEGVQMMQMSGVQLSSSQQTFAQNLGGGDPTVLNAIARAAQETGVPYNLALAVAMAESGLDPKSRGDYKNGAPTSFGLYNLHIGGELTDAGMTPEQAMDPYQNALVALRQFAAVAQADPSVRNDPGRWAALAQRPDDSTAYAARVNSLLQSGFGGAPSSSVPKPFDGYYPITEDHDQGDPGIDYGTPVGTAVYTPFAGTIHVEDKGKGDWGKRVMVVLDNGYTFAIGHLTSFSVADGERVNPGALLGLSGGAVDDPSSGNSTGPHIEIQWISPGGNFLDPHTIIDPILAGTATFRSLNLTGAESITGAQAGLDPQSRMMGVDPALEAQHPTAVSEFKKYFGRDPTGKELLNLVHAAGDTPDGLENYLRAQPSHIPGISIGMYQDVKGTLDSVSSKLYGHDGTDGMVKDLVAGGMTSQSDIQFWLDQQDIMGKMTPNQYAQIYSLSQPYNQAVANETGYDPRTAASIYSSAQQQGVPVPDTPPTGSTATSSLGVPYQPPANTSGDPMQGPSLTQ